MNTKERTPNDSHQHHLDYLLKSDTKGNLVARVLQLPSIIVQGRSESDVHEKISKTTLNYLRHYEDDHKRILRKDPPPKLLTDAGSGLGIIRGTREFIVKC